MLIFDSFTLILLARTDMLDLFFVSYRGNVYIPEKVVSEVTISDKDEAKSIKKYIENKKKVL